MKKIILIFFILLGLSGINGFAGTTGDCELWTGYEVSGSIKEDLGFKIKPEFRYIDNSAEFYYKHIETGIDWKVRSFFITGLYYRHIAVRKNDDWETEHRPHLNATFKWKWLGNFKFSDRNRLEYRIKKDSDNTFRYTNKLTVIFPEMCKQINLKFYLADEIFIEMKDNEFKRNRVYAGFKFNLIEFIKLDTYYLRQSDKKPDGFLDKDITGINLKIIL